MTWEQLNIQYEAAMELATLYQKRGDSTKFYHWYWIASDIMDAKIAQL